MTRVFVARHPTEAHLVAEFLGAEGITAEIRGEALFGVRGDVPPSADTLPTVWVEDVHTGDAQRVLAAANADGFAQPDHGWRCPGCGEAVEPQFTVCWNCGTEAPAVAD